MIRLCDSGGRVAAVDRVGGDGDRGVEAEGVVGAVEVVVDRLRHADDGKTELGVEPGRDAERVLAADRDQRVDLLERALDAFDAALELVRVRARRADDRAALVQDPEISSYPSGTRLPSIIPRQPFRTPNVSCPSSQSRRQTARITD